LPIPSLQACSFSPLAGWPDWSPTAHVQCSIQACLYFTPKEWHPCWSHCGRRTRLQMIPPSSLVISQGWGLIDLPLRATFSPAHPRADIFHPPYPPIASQSISRDVPLAQARASCFLLCDTTLSFLRESPDWPSVRASDEHCLIVRVLRARRMVWRLLSCPSKLARFLNSQGGPIGLPLRTSNVPSKLACTSLQRNGTHAGPTAAVERAHSDCARSGSKGLAWV